MKKDRIAKLFIEELQKLPIVELACKKVGISRQTAYRWKDDDNNLREKWERAMKDGRSVINEMARSKLIGGIKDGDFKFIKFWLSHNDEDFISPQWRFEKSLEKSGQYLTLADLMRAGVKKIEEDKAKTGNPHNSPDYLDDNASSDPKSAENPSQNHFSQLPKSRSESKKDKTGTSRPTNTKHEKGSSDKT